MNTIVKYLWYLRHCGSILFVGIIALVLAAVISQFVLNVINAGKLLKNIVSIIVVSSIGLIVIQKFRESWPPTEQQVREWKRARNRSLSNSSSDDSTGDPIDELPGPSDQDYDPEPWQEKPWRDE
jgi:hypothetical protein